MVKKLQKPVISCVFQRFDGQNIPGASFFIADLETTHQYE